MRTVYIDSTYKCHLTNVDGTVAIEVDGFDDKCDEFVEGYRFIPKGHTWIREDGAAFAGEMAAPWKLHAELDELQRAYELTKLANSVPLSEMDEAYREGVNSV